MEVIILFTYALSELSVRGEIYCNKKYLGKLLEKLEFLVDEYDIVWLDGFIVVSDRVEMLYEYIVVACGVVFRLLTRY